MSSEYSPPATHPLTIPLTFGRAERGQARSVHNYNRSIRRKQSTEVANAGGGGDQAVVPDCGFLERAGLVVPGSTQVQDDADDARAYGKNPKEHRHILRNRRKQRQIEMQ